jgi:hypothetical protein
LKRPQSKVTNRERPVAQSSRAATYIKAGKAAKGLPDAERAPELRRGDPGDRETRGHIYELIGERDKAVAGEHPRQVDGRRDPPSLDPLSRLWPGVLPQSGGYGSVRARIRPVPGDPRRPHARLLVISLAASMCNVGVATLLAAEGPAGAGTTMVLNGSLINAGVAGGAALGGILVALGGYGALGLGLPLFAFAATALAWWPAARLGSGRLPV